MVNDLKVNLGKGSTPVEPLKGLIQCSFAKDLSFRFISCTDLLAELAGCDSYLQMIGKDDYQLAWRRDGDFFRETDISILKSGKCYSQLESIEIKDNASDDSPLSKEIKIVITKAPLFNREGQCIGLCGSFIDVTHLKVLPKLADFDEQRRLWLGENFGNEYLTEAEFNVLRGILVNGERAVARELGISRGTVTTRLQSLKRKFQCNSIVELRRLVILSGFVHELFSKEIIENFVKQNIFLKKS